MDYSHCKSEGLNVVHDGLDLGFRKIKEICPQKLLLPIIYLIMILIGNDIDGVDLNRNFSFNWAFGDTFLEPDNSDYASHYDYYKGEEPFSESEAVAIRDLATIMIFFFNSMAQFKIRNLSGESIHFMEMGR